MKKLSRRKFVKTTAAAAAGVYILPRFSIGQEGPPPCRRLNIAYIGAGGRGKANRTGLIDDNVVALCDVDATLLNEALAENPGAKGFKDFRVMLDKMGSQIEAVVVATPDHTHFAAAMEAMRRGKHVFVEKPLAHNIWQCRTLKKAASHYNVITALGNQGHATEGIRLVKEWVDAGILGDVTEVLAWFHGPTFGEGKFFQHPDSYPPSPEEVPEGLDWDLWLGPVQSRPYSRFYLPRYWRGWYDFGCGELGDWACHTLDAPFWSLDLGMPVEVKSTRRSRSGDGFVPNRCVIRFKFPARGDKPPVTLKWYEGGLKPRRRSKWGMKELPKSGMIMVGDKLSLMTGGRPNSPKLLPEKVWEDFRKNPPPETIPRIKGTHWKEWANAVKGEGPMPMSSFDYGAELTEMALVGVLAQRFKTRIAYDAQTARVTNHRELNAYVKEPVRKGWEYGEEVWKA